MSSKKVTILIPVRNEEKYISKCLDSLFENDIFQTEKDIQIIIIDGDSSDNTINILNDYKNKYKNILILKNPNRIVPISLNIGIKEATGSILIRLDAHAIYPKNYIAKLLLWLEKLNADNIGGICITECTTSNKKTKAIKEVLSNKYGVGNSLFRIGYSDPVEVDTVPFGCFKKETFTKYGYYDERLERNQDIELNKRIINNGGKIYLIPDIKCYYYAREKMRELAKNNYYNGLWNILTAYYTQNVRSLSIRHYIPLIFILTIIIPLLLSVANNALLSISIIIIMIYLISITTISLSLWYKKNLDIKYLIACFMLLHCSYGIGSLIGLLKIAKLQLRGYLR